VIKRGDELLRGYAAGSVSWRALQDQGFEDYIRILDQACERGRNVERQRKAGRDAETRDQFHQQLDSRSGGADRSR